MSNHRKFQDRRGIRELSTTVFATLLLSHVSSSAAQNVIAVRNESPFSWALGLPTAADARLLQASEARTVLSLDWASHYRSNSSGGERLHIDVETTTLSLDWQWSPAQHWQLGLLLPLRYQGDGLMDGMIEQWHNLFNLPQGGRDHFPRDRYLILYRVGNEVRWRQQQYGAQLGDLQLQLARALHSSASQDLSLRFSLKLPTGNYQHLAGNGSWSLAPQLLWQYRFAGGAALNSYLGGQLSSQAKVLAEQQQQLIAIAGASVDYPLSQAWSLQLQLDGHSAGYDSDLTELGEAAIASGALVHRNQRWKFSFAVVEDLLVGASADVNFQFLVEYR